MLPIFFLHLAEHTLSSDIAPDMKCQPTKGSNPNHRMTLKYVKTAYLNFSAVIASSLKLFES